MYLLFTYCSGRNYFDAGKSNTRAIGSGVPRKVETFLGPGTATSKTSAIFHFRAQKVLGFQGPRGGGGGSGKHCI
jgi:hypothetical protein